MDELQVEYPLKPITLSMARLMEEDILAAYDAVSDGLVHVAPVLAFHTFVRPRRDAYEVDVCTFITLMSDRVVIRVHSLTESYYGSIDGGYCSVVLDGVGRSRIIDENVLIIAAEMIRVLIKELM